MIEYKINLNRFYDTKTHKIVSKKKAHDYMLKYHKVPVAVKGDKKKHTKRVAKKRTVKRSNKKSSKYTRPSYKKMYENTEKQLQKLEKYYSAGNYHPFLAHRTKDGDVSPEQNIKDVRNWMKHHTGKLFVIAALDKNNQYDVETCGSVDDLTAAGFAARDLVPSLIKKFSDGYND